MASLGSTRLTDDSTDHRRRYVAEISMGDICQHDVVKALLLRMLGSKLLGGTKPTLKKVGWDTSHLSPLVVAPLLVTFSVSGPQRRQLRSTTTTRSAVVLRTRTQFGRRAFSVSGADIWNSLHVNIRLLDSHPSFRRALKSHF